MDRRSLVDRFDTLLTYFINFRQYILFLIRRRYPGVCLDVGTIKNLHSIKKVPSTNPLFLEPTLPFERLLLLSIGINRIIRPVENVYIMDRSRSVVGHSVCERNKGKTSIPPLSPFLYDSENRFQSLGPSPSRSKLRCARSRS